MASEKILEIRGLKTWFHTERGIVKAVDDVSYVLNKGEILGVVGESGSGKSMSALSIINLIPKSHGRFEGGEICFNGQNLMALPDRELRRVRGNEISMVFQEPMTSLNPVIRIGDQIAEVLMLHAGMKKKEAWKRAEELIETVDIPTPKKVVRSYPHELSGGMRQRVMIAMALACNPSVLIADEPTTALDVTIQAQILDLLNKLRKRTGAGIILITHDLGVVAEVCDRVVVMYCGKIVEQGTVTDVVKNPMHPYTRGLIDSIPKVDEDVARLYNIKGVVPSPYDLPKGCKFAPRCERAMDICGEVEPEFSPLENGRSVRCWLYKEDNDG